MERTPKRTPDFSLPPLWWLILEMAPVLDSHGIARLSSRARIDTGGKAGFSASFKSSTPKSTIFHIFFCRNQLA
jgi:hypothetical protein